MEKLLIDGGVKLEGQVHISGAKNAALPILAACVLTDEPITLHRIPRVRDIRTMEKLMSHVGVRMTKTGRESVVHCLDALRPTFDLIEALDGDRQRGLVKDLRALENALQPRRLPWWVNDPF